MKPANINLKIQRQASLTTANEMFKTAFAVKKMRFSILHPHLSELELTKFTAQYFRNMIDTSK